MIFVCIMKKDKSQYTYIGNDYPEYYHLDLFAGVKESLDKR